MSVRRRNIVVALAAMAVPLLVTLVGFVSHPSAETTWLERARAQTACILPRAEMRYQHMTHLKSLRDRVVRDGDQSEVRRAQAQGITSCKGCHAHREQFCDRCHEQASVSPDCFRCHAY
jgi:hypothetical protein